MTEIVLADQSLDELARIIREEDAAANAAFNDALTHAVRAGEALQQVRSVLPRGDWLRWLEENTPVSTVTARLYVRLARYHATLPDDVRNIEQARAYLTGAPPANPHTHAPDPLIEADIKELRSAGYTYPKIAETVGMSVSTVRKYVNPDYREQQIRYRVEARRKQRSAAKVFAEKEERQRRDAAARKVGGDIAEAYSLVRKLTAAIDRAAATAVDPDHARALKAANHQAFRVEDEIVRILGVL